MKKRFLQAIGLLWVSLAAVLLGTGCTEGIKRGDYVTPYDLSRMGLSGKVMQVTETYKAGRSKDNYEQMYTFNACGQLVEHRIKGARTNETRFIYDARGKLVGVESADLRSYQNVYDEKGRLIKEYEGMQSGDSILVEYTYDEMNRLIGEYVCYWESECYSLTYEYAADGKMVRTVQEGNDEPDVVTLYHDLGDVSSGNGYIYTTAYDSHSNWVSKKGRKKRYRPVEWTRVITYASETEDAREEAVSGSANAVMGSDFFREVTTLPDFLTRIVEKTKLLGQEATHPEQVLLISLLSLMLVALVGSFVMSRKYLSRGWAGQYTAKHMRRMWMYNKEPYIKASAICGIVIGSFVASVLAVFIFGAAVWIVLWAVKLVLYAVVIAGYICVGIGILGMLGEEGWGCLPLVLGGIVIWASDAITAVGEKGVAWGFRFMQRINLLEWAKDLFVHNWDLLLFFLLLPLGLFLGCALLIILLNLLLIGVEAILTWVYTISRPCPVCGSREACDYLVRGRVHPVALRPGLYGTFYQRSPVDGSRLPTLLLNGRWKLERQCRKCKQRITSDMIGGRVRLGFGSDVHIGIIGPPNSGKSYLIYSALGLLRSNDRVSQLDADRDTRVRDLFDIVSRKGSIQTVDKSTYRAIQLVYKEKFRLFPYHLFFYDVSGEQFDNRRELGQQAVLFYRNVRHLVFVIDPTMMQLAGARIERNVRVWMENYMRVHPVSSPVIFNHMLSKVEGILSDNQNKPENIHVYVVVTKSDLGFFRSFGLPLIPSGEEVEAFLNDGIGLSNIVETCKLRFKSVSFLAVSVDRPDSLKDLLNRIGRNEGFTLFRS